MRPKRRIVMYNFRRFATRQFALDGLRGVDGIHVYASELVLAYRGVDCACNRHEHTEFRVDGRDKRFICAFVGLRRVEYICIFNIEEVPPRPILFSSSTNTSTTSTPSASADGT